MPGRPDLPAPSVVDGEEDGTPLGRGAGEELGQTPEAGPRIVELVLVDGILRRLGVEPEEPLAHPALVDRGERPGRVGDSLGTDQGDAVVSARVEWLAAEDGQVQRVLPRARVEPAVGRIV